MSAKIKTTGELRDFLVSMMIGVKNGDLDAERARNITKMAAQVNESFYSEIKIAKVQMEAGQVVTDLGKLRLGSSE